MLMTAASTEINSFELKLFNAIFTKQYLKAARLLKNKMIEGEEGKIRTTKPAGEVREEPSAKPLNKQLISDKMFWSRFSKIVRRIN